MPTLRGEPKVRFNLESVKKESTYIYTYFHYRPKTGGEIQRLKYLSGEKIAPDQWDFAGQRPKASRKHAENTDIRKRLDELEVFILDIYRTHGGDIEPKDFKRQVDMRMGFTPREAKQEATAPKSLFQFIEAFIEEKKIQPRGTWKILLTVSGLLKGFSEERFGRKLAFADIDFEFFSAFQAWLYKAPRNHSVNYASKVASVLRQFMREAQRRKLHDKNDYQSFSIRQVKTFKLALSFKELEQLFALDLRENQRLERVRDLFLIGCYTGLRFSDFSRLRPEHIEESDGKKYLSIITQKTGTQITIPLHRIAEALLTKYQFEAPKISIQKMNDYLKELGQRAGLDRRMFATNSKGGKRKEEVIEQWERLSSHVARRSFATNFYRDGIPASKLMKVTGHATEKQFMAYIQISSMENAVDLAGFFEDRLPLRKVAG